MDGHADEHIFEVFFLKGGEISVDGTPLDFPYRKAKLLLLLLLDARRMRREKICAALWGDQPETARQNLRNALSALRRLLPPGCVASDRTAAWIAPQATIRSDLGELDEATLGTHNIERLSQPFLSGLPTQGQEVGWIDERRRFYAKKLRRALSSKIASAPPDEKNFWQSWLAATDDKPAAETPPRAGARSTFVRTDELESIIRFFGGQPDAGGADDRPDSRGALRLAVILGEEGSGKHSLASEVCRHLEGLDGDGQTSSLAFLASLPSPSSPAFSSFYGRAREGREDYRGMLQTVLKKLLACCNGNIGELKLPSLYAAYLTTAFPEMHTRDTESALTGGDAFYPIVDLNPHLLGRIFAAIFDRVLAKREIRPLLVLEGAHWADRWLPEFLRGILENASPPFAVLLTAYPETKNPLDIALSPLERNVERHEVHLSRLTLAQTEKICAEILPAHMLTPKKLAEIYEHTDGSPFLLGEFLNFYDSDDWSDKLSKSLHEVVHRRLLSLTQNEANLLQCASIFPAEAPFEAVREISGMDDMTLIDTYEQLRRKGLLYEQAAGNSYSILFRYSLIKKMTRESMSGIKRHTLHKRLLAHCRENPHCAVDRRHFATLAHNAGDPMGELAARIDELKKHFEFNHEMFPKLSDAEIFETSRTLNDTLLTGDYLNEANALLNDLIRTHGKTASLISRERALLTLRGGYLRWNGHYRDAENCLSEALKLASQGSDDRDEAVVEVLEQLCYLGIQVDNPDILAKSAAHFYRAAHRAHMYPQTGMALRFLAILHTMRGDPDRAQKLLGMSLRLFEKLEAFGSGYTLSVIAATHYHGDIALHKQQYGEAKAHYMQCVRLCEGKGFYRGLGVHLAKAAWCEIRLGRVDEAERHVNFARPLFEGFRSRRGAGLCGGELIFALSALFNLRNGMPQKAASHLRYAEEIGSIMQKPLWSAMQQCVKAVLRESEKSPIDRILTGSTQHYLEGAEKLFSNLGLACEIEAYRQLRAYAAL